MTAVSQKVYFDVLDDIVAITHTIELLKLNSIDVINDLNGKEICEK